MSVFMIVLNVASEERAVDDDALYEKIMEYVMH